MLDLRKPTGWFFLLIGLTLVAMGAGTTARAPLTDANVNLWAGLAMLLFGGGMLWLTRRTS